MRALPPPPFAKFAQTPGQAAATGAASAATSGQAAATGAASAATSASASSSEPPIADEKSGTADEKAGNKAQSYDEMWGKTGF